MRYRWLGEHSGSIRGRNCYPIETKGKGRRRMDVTSSGTGSPIIGFMIGVYLHSRSHENILFNRFDCKFATYINTSMCAYNFLYYGELHFIIWRIYIIYLRNNNSILDIHKNSAALT